MHLPCLQVCPRGQSILLIHCGYSQNPDKHIPAGAHWASLLHDALSSTTQSRSLHIKPLGQSLLFSQGAPKGKQYPLMHLTPTNGQELIHGWRLTQIKF